MELNLDRLVPGRSELELDENLPLGEGEASRAHIEGYLDVDAMEQRVLVTGGFGVARMAVCDRCSAGFTQEFPAEIELIILRNPSRGDMPEEGEDAWVIEQPRGVVSLDEQLVEAVVLAEPQKTVCREDCKGLCPTCGIDLNENACDCSKQSTDSRWDALKKLRGKLGD